MLRILGADDIHVFPLLATHALAPVTQLLDRRADLHAAGLSDLRQQRARGRRG